MQVISEIAFGCPEMANTAWVLVSVAIVVVAYGIAIVVPSIWSVMVSIQSPAAPTLPLHCAGWLSQTSEL